MKSVLGSKRQRRLEPTPDQLQKAENAAFAAMQRGNKTVLVANHPSQHDKKRMDQAANVVVGQDHLASLRKTTVEEFISNFRVNGLECMSCAYEMRHPIHDSAISGSLTTGLPEDVFHLVDMQLSLLEDFIQAKNILDTAMGTTIIIESIISIIRNLCYHHTKYRYSCLHDIESSVAAANDRVRMLNKLDEMMQKVAECFPKLDWEERGQGDSLTSVIRREVADLMSLYLSDAVHASQRIVTYIMNNVKSSPITKDLFTREWEDVLVQNEIAVAMVKSFDGYMMKLRSYVEHDFLYHKIVAALVRATVCFYTQRFLEKAEQLRRVMRRDFAQKRSRQLVFANPKRAITRIAYDVEIFGGYFHSLAQSVPALERLVTDELSIFMVLIECMWLAAGRSDGASDNLDQYAIVVHKKITGTNSTITRHFLSDLWVLLGPKDSHYSIEKKVKTMDTELQRLSSSLKEESSCKRTTIDESMCLRLDEVLRTHYEDRMIKERLSLCGTLTRPLERSVTVKKECDHENFLDAAQGWYTLKGFRQRLAATKDERELSSLFRKL